MDSVRATYWFIPSIMTLLAAISAVLLLWLDQTIPSYLTQEKWFLFFNPGSLEEARSALNSLAVTALSVIGVVFSVTLVPLTIASSQYGAIILRTFIRDRGTQIVLGSYAATVFYCLFISMGLRSVTVQTTVQLSATVGMYMTMACLILLLYFFHHVADSLVPYVVVAAVSRELNDIIRRDFRLRNASFPLHPTHTRAETDELRRSLLREGHKVASKGAGYVRAVDYDRLVRIAVEHDSILYLRSLPGDFVGQGDQLLLASPSQLDDEATSSINRAYMLGRQRTLLQDPEYGIYNLVTIAVRALSPGINDPMTPQICLDRLGEALGALAERAIPTEYRHDMGGKLRVIADPIEFERLVDAAFDMIREYGRSSTEVLIAMLETIKTVARHTYSSSQRRALLKHGKLIESDSRIGLQSEHDRQRVHDCYEETLRVIGQD